MTRTTHHQGDRSSAHDTVVLAMTTVVAGHQLDEHANRCTGGDWSTRDVDVDQRAAAFAAHQVHQGLGDPAVSAALATRSDVALRAALRQIHRPVGGFCPHCDAERDVDARGNNPGCIHHTRGCHECGQPWPCRTARLWLEHDLVT